MFVVCLTVGLAGDECVVSEHSNESVVAFVVMVRPAGGSCVLVLFLIFLTVRLDKESFFSLYRVWLYNSTAPTFIQMTVQFPSCIYFSHFVLRWSV